MHPPISTQSTSSQPFQPKHFTLEELEARRQARLGTPQTRLGTPPKSVGGPPAVAHQAVGIKGSGHLVNWRTEYLTRIPPSRARGRWDAVLKKWTRHEKRCSCRACQETAQHAAMELREKLPRLLGLVGREVPGNLAILTLAQLYAIFLRERNVLIREVEAGRVVWPG